MKVTRAALLAVPLVAAVAMMPGALAAQQTGAVSGTITDATTNQPLIGAQV